MSPMTSSTSNFDPAAGVAADVGADASWRRWIIVFCATYLGLGGLLFVLLLLIDPYDSARFPTFGIIGIDDHNPRMANVSRARDPRFDAAVFGNSTGQLIDPHHIGPPTGLSFTQLTVPGTGPREQLAIMGWFAAHHDNIGAVVLVADESWCAQNPDLQVLHPFPFWLYGGDRDYLARVLNSKSLDRAVWRVQLALGMRPRTDPVGYSDYTAGKGHVGHVAGKDFEFVAPAPEPAEDPSTAIAPFRFPWILRLRDQIAALPPQASVVIVVPPIYAPMLAPPNSVEAAVVTACKSMLQGSVAVGRRGGLLDFRLDNAITREPGNFVDGGHYRNEVAREIEKRIVAALRPAARTAAVPR
jgi:hypothetical protein